MIETKDLNKFAKHLFTHGRRGAARRQTLSPEREWFFITTLFLFIFLIGAVASVWHYQAYQNLPGQIVGNQSILVPTYQSAAVERSHEMYAVREDRYNALLNDTTTATVETQLQESTTATTTTATTSLLPSSTTASSGEAVPALFY